VYFDGGNKASLYCNLRDHWKNWEKLWSLKWP